MSGRLGKGQCSQIFPISTGRSSHTCKYSFKGTHTVYFSSSLYIINQKAMIPRTHFHCITTWVACPSG